MNKSDFLAKLAAFKSYPAPEELAGILTSIVEVIPAEVFEKPTEQQQAQQPS